MLLPRVLTALVGIPLLLFLIHWGGLTFSFFVAAVSALALYEYGVILQLGDKPCQRLGAVICGSALALCAALAGPLGLVASAAVAWVMLGEMFGREHSLDRAALTLFGALFLGWMPAHLALIRELRPDGERFTFMLVLSVWAMDTAAYAAGTVWGRHKLAEGLSPKKTWEGAAAGFAAALAVVLIFRGLYPAVLSLTGALLLGALVGIAGQISDLAESLVKRAVGAKDSGALLPGHGGVMDRFDSFILAAPAVYYFLALR